MGFARFFAIILLFLFAIKSYSQVNEQFLVVPDCLLGDEFSYAELAQAENLRLIKTSQLARLQTASIKKPRHCRGFMNVTHDWQRYSLRRNSKAAQFLQRYLDYGELSDLTRGYKIQHQSPIHSLIAEINARQVENHVAELSAFPDRYADSESGQEAADWIESQVKKMAAASGHNDIEIYKISTMGVKQPSIVLKIGRHLTGPAVVIGAPMDTLAASFHHKKPGADDNASGAATILEAARVLLDSSYKLKKPLYFIWYAGEKAGKLGSQSVVKHFNQNSISVDAVLQLDMTGYLNKSNTGIGLVDDFTDGGLTAFVADLVAVYVKKPAGVVRCGYACGDHASWYLNGNRVAYPFETMDDKGNPYARTHKDTADRVSVVRMLDFVKLSIAFAVELGEVI